ncbi:MAG: class B sortase [Lachnospiraceae bacterium]|nr:class B sortase [Lachnospiraceae bacterium]
MKTNGRDTKKTAKKKKKKGGKWRASDLVILVIAGLVLVVSLWKLAGIFLEYKAGTDAYENLEKLYVEKVETKGQEQETETELSKETGMFPEVSIDFASLKEINEELIGWIFIPVLDIDYPVVQGTDNDYYLTHTFDKKTNSSGAIFVDYGANHDLTDYNTLIYGHNMKNGSMFGSLKKFIRDEELCGTDPYFYIYTEEKRYQYLIISYYVTMDGSNTYLLPASEEEYESYKNWILRSSPYDCPEDIPESGNIVTLSTCYGKSGSDQRFVVHGILVDVQEQTE